MIKTSLIAVMTVLAVSGAVAPAFAAYSLVEDYNNEDQDNDASFHPSTVLDQLQANGVNATSVETWGHLIRAFVQQDDGREVQQFFTRDSLRPVSL